MSGKTELEQDAVTWLISGERGISSEALFNRTLLGQSGSRWPSNFPHDPDDFRRCQLLCRAVPLVAKRLSMMNTEGPEWAALVDHWWEVAALLESEVPGVFDGAHGRAPKTYELMQNLRPNAVRPT